MRVVGAVGSAETVTLGGAAALEDDGSNENFLSATRLSNIGTNGGTEYRSVFRRIWGKAATPMSTKFLRPVSGNQSIEFTDRHGCRL